MVVEFGIVDMNVLCPSPHFKQRSTGTRAKVAKKKKKNLGEHQKMSPEVGGHRVMCLTLSRRPLSAEGGKL